MKRIFQLLFLLAAFSNGCVRAPENKNAGKTIRIATSYKIQNLDPLKSAFYFLIEYGAAETPLLIDDAANLKPHLLESWAQIDELNWRLTIRPNVKFHNGKMLTAERFAAAMNRQLEKSAATKTYLPNATVKVSDERELILTTAQPDPNVPAALADESVFPIYDTESIEPAGSDSLKIIACGCFTGAYKIQNLDERELILTRFADYWQGTPPLDSVVVKFVPDAQSRILAVQSDEADIALYPPTEAKRMLANQSNAFFAASETASGGARFWFNVRRPPFDETNVRRAVSLGINYESLAKNTMDGVFQTADGFYPPAFLWAIQNQKTDVAEARKLLDAANWHENGGGLRERNGEKLSAVLIVYPQQPDWVTIATAIQAQLREIGFDVQIRQVDDINAALRNPANWNLAISSPGIVTNGGAPDPDLRDYFQTGATNNFGGVSDAQLDKLLSELTRTFDAEKRKNMLHRIQQIVVVEQAFEVRPVFSRSRAIVGRRFKNYRPSPRLRHVTFATTASEN